LGNAADKDSCTAGYSTEQLQKKLFQEAVAPRELQFYDGECVWSSLQLETELAAGAWICVKTKLKELRRLQQTEILRGRR